MTARSRIREWQPDCSKTRVAARARSSSTASSAACRASARSTREATPERHGVDVVRDVAYATTASSEHRLDVYRPRRARAGPAPDRALRARRRLPHPLEGHALADGARVRAARLPRLQHRATGSRPRTRFPAAIEDVCDVARVGASTNAAQLGRRRSTRIVLAGESAGANLVTSLALACCYERDEPFARRVFDAGIVPRAVLPACGIFQVSDVQRFARRKRGLPAASSLDRLEEVARRLPRAPRRRTAVLELADPLCLFERGAPPARALPPFFLPVGHRGSAARRHPPHAPRARAARRRRPRRASIRARSTRSTRSCSARARARAGTTRSSSSIVTARWTSTDRPGTAPDGPG